MKKDIALYEWEKKTKEFKPNVFFSFLFPLKGFIPNPCNLHKLIFLCIIDGWVDGGGKFVFNLKNPFVGFASPYFGHHVTKIHHKKNLDSWMKLIYGHFFKIIVNEVYSSLSIFCSQYIYNPFNTKQLNLSLGMFHCNWVITHNHCVHYKSYNHNDFHVHIV